ncbi:MBL fold metallo-hydrolase [Paenibacillus filicis]|uniref:MBL fold metallo-hydrolase n=1 Tax=Paenibacillus gyeongsangnamensis TaxID=3388067 RepID=A0ABT4QHB4_9BACL|nr:MBL fold metallo-hydrolase [Paenibacillus filicis]MCZ8516193.1 MBL fold metallo-hydrolase [Paenibacillus filicis]
MQANCGLEMLRLSADLLGETRVIHPTLIWDEDNVILVDTGYPGQWPMLREAVQAAGVQAERINRVVLTHQDVDHIGALPQLLAETPHPVEVSAHSLEMPYIQGEKPLLRFTAEALAEIETWPEAFSSAFKRLIANPPKAAVDRTLADGDRLPYGGGLVVIETTGHTPGHISLYHPSSKTLIAGDALTAAGDRLLGPDPRSTLEPAAALQSLRRLASYDIETVICYHGGLYRGDANRRIAELANGG